ncbi:unnamed protein product [Mytilus edulis]|uniref:Uncharacterized protein n=1 Tax=Mytilus edulis TaxID=6550 RepID=A0A8S3RRB8_MYTED|nr:unnamed protein product [Mytilus edulis]
MTRTDWGISKSHIGILKVVLLMNCSQENVSHFFVSFLLYYGPVCLHAFLLETSTLAKSVGGPVTNVGNDNHYSALIELLMDEKQHRYQLEQRVATLEQRSGSTQQAARILQLENFVKHLENDLSSVKQSLAQQLNKKLYRGRSSTCNKRSECYLHAKVQRSFT